MAPGEKPGPAGPPGRGPEPVERVRDEHPSGDDWRADALAKSRHSRLLDEIRAPLEDFDPERSAALCGEICRLALRDFAPALILLPAAERSRAQALTAFALMLFDFAEQAGLEGERLAQINRLEFNLELALAGEPPGQPVFVQLSRERESRPWPEGALGELVALARGRVLRPGLAGGGRDDATRLGAALATALAGSEPPAEVVELAAALLRLRRLQDRSARGGGGARRRTTGGPRGDTPPPHREECARLRPLFGDARRAVAAAPSTHRRAVRYLALAAAKLLERIEAAPAEPAGLGGLTRVGLLLRARLG